MERLGKLTLTDLALAEKDFMWCERIAEIAKNQPVATTPASKVIKEIKKEDSKVSDFNRLLNRINIAIEEDQEFQVAFLSNIVISYVTRMDDETREVIKPELAKITAKIVSYRNSKLGEDNEDFEDDDKYFGEEY
jgi:hypothetical protein